MSLQIKCRRCTIEDTLKVYVEKKSARLNRFFSKILNQEVTFTGEKFRFICTIELSAPPLSVISTVEENEPRAAFDKALKAVEGQLKRQKTRMIDSKRKSPAESNLPESPETPIPEDEDTEE